MIELPFLEGLFDIAGAFNPFLAIINAIIALFDLFFGAGGLFGGAL